MSQLSEDEKKLATLLKNIDDANDPSRRTGKLKYAEKGSDEYRQILSLVSIPSVDLSKTINDRPGYSLFEMVLRCTDDKEILEAIFEWSRTPFTNISPVMHLNPLTMAIDRGIDISILLKRPDINVNYTDSNGWTALHNIVEKLKTMISNKKEWTDDFFITEENFKTLLKDPRTDVNILARIEQNGEFTTRPDDLLTNNNRYYYDRTGIVRRIIREKGYVKLIEEVRRKRPELKKVHAIGRSHGFPIDVDTIIYKQIVGDNKPKQQLTEEEKKDNQAMFFEKQQPKLEREQMAAEDRSTTTTPAPAPAPAPGPKPKPTPEELRALRVARFDRKNGNTGGRKTRRKRNLRKKTVRTK